MTSRPVSMSANLIGTLFMIAAMGVFAIEDALIKAAGAIMPLGQVMIFFGLGGALVFASLTLLRGAPLFTPDVVSRPMRIRVGFEITGRLFYFLAITLTPLSAATVILQATPLVVVACAALVFGETVGWKRWAAIVIGLIGVIVIIRPGSDSFSALSLLAVIGMLGFAGRDLASRAAPASISTALLGLYGFLSVVVAGSLFALWSGEPFVWLDRSGWLVLGAAVFSGVFAYSFLMKAMRTGEISAVTPFRYTRLLFGVALGVILFGESLSPTILLGSGLIVCSGLFIVWRARQAG
ncbi:DMT family transporter [Neptunicoccus cionae]|uniref:DMT family transporter n=1 Tax=Neptunicoccus cionae TaxID=2035344 RepID=UPI000C75E7D5|nr:DMT family transporter [Amylibacter cionae]PLS22263.1 EamA family transporter [Amylibacter cionae]